MQLSIIIISFNTKELTLSCIESVYNETKNIAFELIIVDNASSDGSTDAIEGNYPDVKLIRSKENLGFARANNLAAEQASGDYILLLNSDTVILDEAISKLLAFAETQKIERVYGGSTFFADGARNSTSCWSKPTVWSTFCIAIGFATLFRKSRLFNSESYIWWNWGVPREVDIISGCFLLLPKRLWDALEGFSPDFFMYGEDADLCLRSIAFGAKPMVYPEAKIIHYGGASESLQSEKKIKLITAKKQLYLKHWSKINSRLGFFWLNSWAFIRMSAYFFKKIFRKDTNSSYNSWETVWKSVSVQKIQ